MGAICTITTESDADFRQGFVYKTAAGVAIDITGASMHMAIRKHATDVAAQLSLTDAPGIVITSAVGGAFYVFIAQAQLLTLAPGDYVHSLIMTKDGLKTKLWSGTLVHSAGPSR